MRVRYTTEPPQLGLISPKPLSFNFQFHIKISFRISSDSHSTVLHVDEKKWLAPSNHLVRAHPSQVFHLTRRANSLHKRIPRCSSPKLYPKALSKTLLIYFRHILIRQYFSSKTSPSFPTLARPRYVLTYTVSHSVTRERSMSTFPKCFLN